MLIDLEARKEEAKNRQEQQEQLERDAAKAKAKAKAKAEDQEKLDEKKRLQDFVANFLGQESLEGFLKE